MKSYYRHDDCMRSARHDEHIRNVQHNECQRFKYFRQDGQVRISEALVCVRALECVDYVPDKRVLPILFGYSFQKPDDSDRLDEAGIYQQVLKRTGNQNLTGRVVNALERAGIYTVGQLSRMTGRWLDLFSMTKDVGPAITNEVRILMHSRESD